MLVKGRKIFLRTVRETDLAWLYEKECDIEQLGLYYPVFLSSEAGFYERFRRTGFWQERSGDALVCSLQDGTILGKMEYFEAEQYWDNYEVAYRLFDLELSGRGIISEALRLFTYLLFATYRVNRLELKIIPQNAASLRVAQKCGFQFEGVARQAVFLRGAHHDMHIYSLLRSEAPRTLEEALGSRAGG